MNEGCDLSNKPPFVQFLKEGNSMQTKRLSVEITEQEQIRMRNLIPWGLVSRIMRILLIQTLDLIEQHGDVVLGALISGRLNSLDLLKKEGITVGLDRLKTINKQSINGGVDETDS